VVTTDNEVGRTVVLTDDRVPDSLTGATHTHSEGQETEDCHTVGVAREKGLVGADPGEVVNVTGLGQTNDRVDEDIGLTGTCSTDGQLTVSSVHRVSVDSVSHAISVSAARTSQDKPGLESDNSGPAELVEVDTKLRGGV
jgi:hypothetical protein